MSEINLEPCGLGHELLSDWAAWARDDNEGRAGWSVKPRVDRGYHGDPPERWYVVNRIISHLLHREPDFARIVKPYYLGEYSVGEIARMRGRSEKGVLVVLMHVCGLVEREYRDATGT